MVDNTSLSKQAKKLEKYIYTLKATRELNKLDRQARDVAFKLRDSVSKARGAVERHANSDDTEEKRLALQEAIEQLKITDKAILLASEFELLDVADVAHLSALNEQIIDQLK